MFNFFRRKDRDPQKDLKGLLHNYELQSFPAVTTSVLGMLRDPESSIVEIAEQVEMDPGMHVKVLQLVNSVAFGLMKKVSSLRHAVTLLGRSRLESVVLSIAVSNSLPAANSFSFDASHFWLVAARRACLARLLAQHLHAATQAECFTAALLQDVAIPVLSTVKKEKYDTIIDQWNADAELDIIDLEKETFGYDHAHVGSLIAGSWGLPDYLVNAIGGHHGSDEEIKVDPAIRLVAHLRYNDASDGTEKILFDCRETFHISEELVRDMISTSFEEAKKISQILH
jgi:HD-like signal output (HDOD) protein